MLIKSADDKSKRLALLQNLQQSPMLDARQKEWLRDELRRCKTGMDGERAAAFYLDGHYKDSQNNVLLHDLRFEIDGEVAQIDHLVINRTGYIVLIETKNYSGDLEVNAHGEFTVRYGKEHYGIPSPFEQSRRHARILSKLLERLEIGTRTDKLPDFHNVVMMHAKVIIQRPDPKAFDTSFLIKADQFPAWHEKLVGGVGTGGFLKALINCVARKRLPNGGKSSSASTVQRICWTYRHSCSRNPSWYKPPPCQRVPRRLQRKCPLHPQFQKPTPHWLKS